MGLFKRSKLKEHRWLKGPTNKYGYGYGGATRNKDVERAMKLGLSQAEGRNFIGALKFFQDAISIEPDNYGIYGAAGMAAYGAAVVNNQENMYEVAIKFFEKALELDPDPDTKKEIEDSLRKAKDDYESSPYREKRLKERIESGEMNSQLYLEYADTIKKTSINDEITMRNAREAIPYYLKAIELDPTNKVARDHYVYALRRSIDYSDPQQRLNYYFGEAEKQYKEILNFDPTDSDTQKKLFRIQREHFLTKLELGDREALSDTERAQKYLNEKEEECKKHLEDAPDFYQKELEKISRLKKELEAFQSKTNST